MRKIRRRSESRNEGSRSSGATEPQPRPAIRCPCTRGIGTSTMRRVQGLQREAAHRHHFSRNLDAQETKVPTRKWWLLVGARWSLLVPSRGCCQEDGRHQTSVDNTWGGARGHRDNGTSLVAVGVRGACNQEKPKHGKTCSV